MSLRDDLLAKYDVSPTLPGKQLPSKAAGAAAAGANISVPNAKDHPIVTGDIKSNGQTQTLKENLVSKYLDSPSTSTEKIIPLPINATGAQSAAVAGSQNGNFQPIDIPQVSQNTQTSGVSTDNIISGKENDGFTTALANTPADFLGQMMKNIRATSQLVATIPAGIGGLGVRTEPIESKSSGTSGISTPSTFNTVGKNTLDPSLAIPAMKESLNSVKEMLLDPTVSPSKGLDEASQMYLKSRKIGKYGGNNPGIQDVAVLSAFGLFDLLGDPATAVGLNEVKALKEFATFRKVGTVVKDLQEGVKIVNPIERTFNFGDNLMMKVKPKEGEVVFEGYVRRYPKQSTVTGAIEGGESATKTAASASAQSDATQVQQFISKLSEGNPNMEVKASIRNGDLVLKPQLTEEGAKNFVQSAKATQITANATQLANKPINEDTLQKIQMLNPQETSAFGRKVVSDLSKSLGVELKKEDLNLDQNTFVKTTPSVDGRPATINPQTKQVEVYLPNLVEDIKTMANGGKILAHGSGTGAYAQVYKMNPGESMSQLATRYISDVLKHEQAHLETITGADLEEQSHLQREVYQAQATKNQNKIIEAKTNLDKFMQGLEDKANKYVAENRVALEQKLFNGRQIDTSQLVEKTTGVTPEKAPQAIVKGNEKNLLIDKLRKEQTVARRGASQGRRVGLQEQKNIQTTQLEKVRREGETKLLKQRIIDRSKAQAEKEQIVKEAEKHIKDERSKFQKTVDKINDKTASIQAKRDTLTELAQLLPAKSRGKLLTAINSTKSDKNFLSVVDRIKKEANIEERATLLREIQKEIKKTKIKGPIQSAQGKFGPIAQRELDIIRKNLGKSYDEAQQKIFDLIDSKEVDEATGERQMLTDEEQRQIERLKMQGVKDMDAKELRYVLDNIKSLKENGKSIRDAELAERKAQDDEVKAQGLGVITGDGTAAPRKGVLKTMVSMVQKTTMYEKMVNFLRTGLPGFDTYLNKLSFFDKKSAPDESFLNRKFGRDVHEAGNKEYLGLKENVDKLQELTKHAYKLEGDVQVLSKIADLNKETKLGEFRNTDGQIKELTMTKGQMINLYQMQKRSRLEETISKQFTPEQLAAVDQALTPEDKQFGDNLLTFADEYYDRINAVFSKQNGFNLPREDFYFPVFRQGADLDNLSDMALLEGEAKQARPTVKNRSLKASTKSTLPLDLRNPFATMMWYTTRMEHYINYAETARQLSKFFNDKDVRQAITDYFSFETYKMGKNMLSNIVRGGIERAKINRTLQKLAGNTASALLQFNVRSAIGQLVDFFTYPLKMPVGSYFANVAKFWMNPRENYKFMKENSTFLQERLNKGYSDEIRLAMDAAESGKMHTYGRLKHKMAELGFLMFEGVDRLVSLPGMFSAYQYKYNELLKNGLSPEQAKSDAMYFAESLTKNLRESGRIDTKSELEMQSTLMKALNLFRSQQAKINAQLADNIRNWRSGRGDKKVIAQRLALGWIILPLIYQYIANRQASDKEKITNAIVSPLTNIPIVGNIAQVILDNLFKHQYTYRPSVISAFADDLTRAAKDLVGKNGGLDKALIDFVDAFGKVEGLPTRLITTPIRKEMKANQEEETKAKQERSLKNKHIKFN